MGVWNERNAEVWEIYFSKQSRRALVYCNLLNKPNKNMFLSKALGETQNSKSEIYRFFQSFRTNGE